MMKTITNKTVTSFALLGVLLSTATSVLGNPEPPIVGIPAGLNPLGPQYSSPNGGAAVVFGQELFAAGGDVTVTFLGPTGASYDEHLFVSSPPSAYGNFMDNHSTANGTTYDLGTFAAGTEIVFGLYVDSTLNTFYDGPASRNFDGVVHAYMVNNYEGLANTTYVGFEDLLGSIADYNYVDEVYAFTGASAAPAPDASSTIPLLGMGLAALACFGRRLRK
jgi:hypothetical protein